MKKFFLAILMVFSVSMVSFPAKILADSTIDPSTDTNFNQRVNNLINRKGYSGTLLLIKNGKPIYQTSHGFSNHADGIYNNKNMTFEIDSIQKSMTAAMIMKEVQNNKLKLTDKLYKFYPEIPGSKQITIKQMLDMTSGLVMPGNVGPDKIMTDKNIINTDVGNIKFSKVIYGNWDYSPVNYNLLSGILEQLTGKSYRTLYTNTFIKKLNLKHTIFAYDEKSGIQKATGYSNINPVSAKLDYKNAFDTKKAYEFDELGTGQVYMSAGDLYKVEKYILTSSYLTDDSRKELYLPGSSSTYGGGFYHNGSDNYANGWGYGFQAVIHISDDGKDAVVTLQNYQRLAADMKPVAKQLYGMLNGN